MRRNKKIKHRLSMTIAVLGALFIAPIAGMAFIVYLYGTVSLSQQVVEETHAALPDIEAEPLPLKPITIALLGYGGGNHDGGRLADTIMLAEIDAADKTLKLLSVPRDLWVEMPVRPSQSIAYKINTAYAIGSDDERYPYKPEEFKGVHGGGKLAKTVLETVTGIYPDYYLAVSFSGFLKAIDLLGGVTVDVPMTFDDPFYPIAGKETDACGKSEAEIQDLMRRYRDFELEKQFTCRYEQLHFDAGPQTMDAATALKFVRSRHSSQHGSDFSRAQRQQALIEGVKSKVMSLSFLTKIIPMAQEMRQHVSTDIDFTAARKLYGLYQQMQSFEIVSSQLTTENVLKDSVGPNKQYILIPKAGIHRWEEVNQFVSSEFSNDARDGTN